MSSETLTPDGNTRNVAGAVTDDSNLYIKRLRIDDTTKGLKVMLVGGSGAGTVTSVSVATANGFSGTVATATTTPAITIIAGAITPTSVNGLTITANGTNTLNIAAGQTLTVTTGGTLGTAAYTASSAYATSTQGTTADNALPKAGGTMTGKVTEAGRDEVGKTYTPASGSQTVALDCAVNNIHVVTGNASGTAITFTVANATNSQCFIVSILQGSGTVSTIAGWFATVRWAGGTPPTLTATLNKRDTFGFIRTGSATYDGFIIGQNC
jgi:hypothetical protein